MADGPTIRPERAEDEAAVRQVVELAFGRPVEARLVELLRRREQIISLVAEIDGQVVGHIMFAEVTVGGWACNVLGLAPLAVLPARQGQGVGSALVRQGLEACRQAGAAAVIVLGHPTYYPRFGFTPASSFGLRYENPHFSPEQIEAAFMALELVPGGLAGVGGLVGLGPEFDTF
mgnify:CR=1 FL=1